MENVYICNYPNCRNRYKKVELKCKCCNIYFCSDNCLIEHMVIIKQKKDRDLSRLNKKKNKKASNNINLKLSNNTEMKINNEDDGHLSIFIKPGEILKDREINSYFDLNNFEKIKSPKTGTKIIGNGAFGEVYLVKNKIDGKLYALKQMEKSRLSSVGIQSEIVYREINIHKKLKHDHIVRLYAYHEDSRAFYLIIEYVENGTLFTQIQKSGGMNEDDAFTYFIQVTSALYFLHSNKIMHRDLKPENCLIDKDGNIKLCDFGWAVESSKDTRATFCGTYEYMAPEIIREVPYDEAIDVWSVGILLYELIHSYSPFSIKKQVNTKDNNQSIDSSVEVLKNILKSKLRFDKPVSEDCKFLIKVLLSPNADDRINIKDIFKHEWVKKYEKRINKNINTYSSTLNTAPNLKKFNTLNIDPIKNKYNINFENKSIDSIKDLNKNVHVTVLKENIIGDNLFDSVLDMVEGKNKSKRKSQGEANFRISIDNIYKTIEDEIKKKNKEKGNRIVLKIQKNHKKKKDSYGSNNDNHNDNGQERLLEMSPIKTLLCDESNFSMYKEIKEIGKKIDEKSRKYEILKKRTDKMRHMLNISINKNFLSNEIPGQEEIFYLDSCGNFENLKTQPQSIINQSEEYALNLANSNRKIKNSYNDNNDDFFNNYNNIRPSKNKKATGIGVNTNTNSNIKSLKQLNDQLENIYSNANTVDDNSNSNQLKILNKSEISTQTETPSTSLFSRIFGSFKCG